MVLEKGDDSSKGYRTKLGIIRDILLVAEKAGSYGSRKTHLMYGANLSYKLLKRYLKESLDAGLLCEGSSVYFITDKGREFIRLYEDCEKESREIVKHKTRLKNGKAELSRMLSLVGREG